MLNNSGVFIIEFLNLSIRTKIGAAPIEEKMRENCLHDGLIMCDVDLQMRQSASKTYQIRAS